MKETTKPLLSLICVTYNRQNKIKRAIKSFLDNNSDLSELVLIDDGSNDNTFDFIKGFLKSNKIIYHKLEKNMGVGFARNYGVKISNADWIVLLDSDNELKPNSIKLFINVINNFSHIDMHKFKVVNFENKMMCENLDHSKTINFREYLTEAIKGEHQTLVKKKYLLKNKFFEEFNGGERLTWSLIAKECKKVMYHPFVSQLYDDNGIDRLSIRSKNTSRLLEIFAKDIKLFWFNYLTINPVFFLIKLSKFTYYFILDKFRKKI